MAVGFHQQQQHLSNSLCNRIAYIFHIDMNLWLELLVTHHNDQARALRGGMDPGDFMDEAPADAADAADVSCFGASSDLLAGNIVSSLGF